MKRIVQRIVAVLAGLLAGGVCVGVIEGMSSYIYKMPPGLDQNKPEFAIWVSELPVGAFLFLLAAWACGCFVGAFVARRLAPGRSAIPGVIVWGFFTCASIWMLATIPHPLWFQIVAIPVCLISGLLGLLLAAPREYVVRCHRTINASREKVFKTLASIDEFSKAVPGIKHVEFLSDQHYGVGTRFRETRLMNGKEAATELEVTELVENQHIRLVSDTGGTIWDTIFRVEPAGDKVEMEMQMDARPHQFFARVITPMILGMVSKFVYQDMDSIKAYCERSDE